MILRRNLLSSLYSCLFMVLMGLGFVQVSYYALINAVNRNLVACIIILGIMIYLIAAFFIKERNLLSFFQNKCWYFIMLELLLVLCSGAGIFYFHLENGLENAVCIMILLLSIYSCSRLLGGRICGVIALVTGFIFLLNTLNTAFESEQMINTLCFLLPYAAFLYCTKIIAKKIVNNLFLTVCSYLVLAILFSFTIMVNPLVCFLLVGCTFSLFFARYESDNKEGKRLSGPVCACILVFVVGILLLAIQFIYMDMISPVLKGIDDSLLSADSWKALGQYMLDKYTKSNNFIFHTFRISFIPVMLMFFGVLAGFYCICRKHSGIGPLCLAFIGTWCYYIMFERYGSSFYYLAYFLPVFSSYGIYHTLIKERVPLVPSLQKEPEVEPPIEETQNEVTETANVQKPKKEELVFMKPDNEIPEWTAPAEYMEQDEPQPAEVEILDIPVSSEAEEDTMISKDNLKLVEPATVEQIDKLDENDMEQFLSNEENEDSSILLPTEQEEPDDTKLHTLLERLDITDNIRRMNESAQEDIADVIEKEDCFDDELEEQMTLDLDDYEPEPHFHSTLPKYKKPEFDFKMEPVSQPLEDSYSQISEYDKVPTISDLEHKWRDINETTGSAVEELPASSFVQEELVAVKEEEPAIQFPEKNSGFAYSLDDVSDSLDAKSEQETSSTKAQTVHTEEVVKKTGISKRSYHKITIR